MHFIRSGTVEGCNDEPCKVAIVIPVRDPGRSFESLLERLVEMVPARRVLVVDDGSEGVDWGLIRAKGLNVVRHGSNQGKGAALKSGFRWALENGFEAVVTLDADGQHDCRDMLLLFEAMKKTGADLVVGSRMERPTGMPLLRLAVNKLTSGIVSLLAGVRLRDTQSGFRLIKRDVLNSVRLRTSRYDTESEILIKAARMGFTVTEVPVKSIYPGGKSHISPLADSLRFIALVVRSLRWLRGQRSCSYC